jgi:hypothetical protein
LLEAKINTTARGTHPNSKEALVKSARMKKKDASQVSITLSPKAIEEIARALYKLSKKEGKRVTRSGLLEELAIKGSDWLVAAVSLPGNKFPAKRGKGTKGRQGRSHQKQIPPPRPAD